MRRIDAADGLLTGGVRSIAQDSVGFIWLGTVGGLHRWDGNRLVHWAPHQLRGWVNQIVACPDGQLFALEEPGRVWQITTDSAVGVPAPADHIETGPVTFGCDATSHLWLANWDQVWQRTTTAGWVEMLPGTMRGQLVEVLSDPTQDGAWLGTRSAVWHLDGDGTVHRVAQVPRAVVVSVSAEGDTLILSRTGALWRVSGNALTKVYEVPGRGIGLVRRGASVYASHDRYLVRVGASEPPIVVGPDEIPEGGGPLLLDREGSLWLATPNGVLQFSEPETLLWTGRHGLPSAFTRYLARQDERIWVTTWQGTGFVERSGQGWRATTADQWPSSSGLAVDGQGTLWIATATGVHEVRNGRAEATHPWGVPTMQFQSEPLPAGGVWMATNRGLVTAHSSDGNGPVRLVETPIGGTLLRVKRMRSGVVWLVGGERVCHTRAPVESWVSVEWICEDVPGAVELRGIAELPDGGVWLASSRSGVHARRGGAWVPLPGNADLPSRSVLGLEPAPSGGIWVYGHGMALRVRPDSTRPEGWEVLESVTAWQGVPANVFSDLLEEADGTLWLATAMGVARVPAAARTIPELAPRVALVEARVDADLVSPDSEPVLPFRHHRLEVRFAAMSYRAPSLLRYQVRLLPDETWTDVRGEPSFRWIDLPRGDYRAEVRASLDGRIWSAETGGFAFSVRGPWYLEPWSLLLGALLLLGAAGAAYRARVGVLLEMERQRTRIAMDLHDELGSGLGGVGILAGVLAEGTPDEPERRRLARQVMHISEELGTALSDIVWSLDPRDGTLSELGARLREHGTRLFATGEAQFRVDLPDPWPQLQLNSTVRRSLLLVGLEALHNVSRHASASEVSLALRLTDDQLELIVEDNGSGLPNGGAPSSTAGRGLTSMARRATEAGGRLDLDSRPGGGTIVRFVVPRRSLSRS
ncbi:MAG: ATP-binding protein [Gemmatimonadales bacterium]